MLKTSLQLKYFIDRILETPKRPSSEPHDATT
jgi:hypothetical protein